MLIGIYETVSGTRSLKYILTPHGRAVKSGSSFEYEYNITDHLGNVRAVIKKYTGGLPMVVQARHYYSFGMEMSQLNNGTTINKYQYNGKEIQDDFGLYWYDYGARMYDPMIGRWHTVDPSASSYYSISPYVYCGNNPIRLIDPDGRDWKDKVVGTTVAVVDNAIGLNLRGSYIPTDAVDYNTGQDMGDVASILLGAGEADAGGGIAAGAAIVTAGSGGLSIEVSGPAFAVGSAMAVHGTILAANGAENLMLQKGRVDEKKVNPKKEQREAAKEKRNQQPGSEKRAKDLGKNLEKISGKDARRAAHDAKEKGADDRTVKQLKEDYDPKNYK